jgi:hypothetical protein
MKRESLHGEGIEERSFGSSTIHLSPRAFHGVPENAMSKAGSVGSPFSKTADHCPARHLRAAVGASLHYFVGTAILYSSKGVANTAILNSSSAALGLIPPSRSLSILNHFAIPTRTVS